MAARRGRGSTTTPPESLDPYSFPLSEEQITLRERAYLAASQIALPDAVRRDAERRFPREELLRLSAAGWFGIGAGAEHGGSDLDTTSIAIVVAEFSRACASIGLLLAYHTIVLDAVRRAAPPPVGERLLSGLAGGGMLGALALADPVHRADRAAAVAARGEKGFVLRNWKSFVPGAVGAGLFLVYAFVADDSLHAPRQRVLLLVPRDESRLFVGEADALIGVRASGTASVRFDSLPVPAIHEIGSTLEDRASLRAVLGFADILVAAQAVGIAEAAHERAVAFAGSRDADGEMAGTRQRVQFPIADMRVALDASRLLLLRACRAREAGGDFVYEAAQARAHASRSAVRIADSAIQIVGGVGSLADHGIERHFRDAKTTELNPSTREAALLGCARRLLEE